MKRDDVIRMAQECNLIGMRPHLDGIYQESIERFAALAYAAGAEAEREECAKVADRISEDQWALYKGRPPYTGQELERASDYTQGKSDGAEVCAAAIRARGNT